MVKMVAFAVLLVFIVAIRHWRGSLWIAAGVLAYWLLMAHPFYGYLWITGMVLVGAAVARASSRREYREVVAADTEERRRMQRQADLNADALVRKLSNMTP